MDVDAFRKELLGTFEPMDRRLWDLAVEYHQRCEAYDRTVCTGPIVKDGIMPVTHRELALINRHAVVVRRDIAQRAEQMGFTRKELQKAISSAADEA